MYSISISPSLTLLSPKKMSAATLFIPLSEKSIKDSWMGDWRDKTHNKEQEIYMRSSTIHNMVKTKITYTRIQIYF